MTIFDRYLLKRYAHAFVIGYAALFGLYFVIDVFIWAAPQEIAVAAPGWLVVAHAVTGLDVDLSTLLTAPAYAHQSRESAASWSRPLAVSW